MAENKRFTKMSKKSKYAAYMYLAIAICVVAVMTVSIYSLSFTDDPGELGISIPDIPTPSLPDKTAPATSPTPPPPRRSTARRAASTTQSLKSPPSSSPSKGR